MWTKFLILLLLFTGCKETENFSSSTKNDSIVQVKIQHDSIYLSQRDSVYIYRSPDSVYKEVWKIQYKDREKLKLDTVFIERIRYDTIKQVIKPASTAKKKSGKFTAFIVAFVIIGILFAAWWFFRKKL